jgi:hypothetical protein
MPSLNIGFDDIFANVPIDEIDDAKKGIGKYEMKRNKIVFNNILQYRFSKHLHAKHVCDSSGCLIEQGYAKQLPRGFYWHINEDQELVGFYCEATSSINDISLLMEYVIYSLHEQGEENIEINAV